jgi:glycosyltransferase involved in cell wall biosynthesis
MAAQPDAGKSARRRSQSMTHLFINSLAASAGGGLTYIRNVIPQLAAVPDLRVTVALGSGLREEFRVFPNIEFLKMEIPSGRRFWFEQTKLSGVIRQCRADALLSAGNFALRKSPVPQILLSRNSLYTSQDFYRDLRTRHEYRLWLDTHLRARIAKKSVRWADITVAPSEAFAADLRHWTGRPVQAIHHGFDREAFTRDCGPLAAEVEESLRSAEGAVKLLFVSHYNYYRNFETLLRALPFVRERLADRKIKLLLTCKLLADENPGSYHPEMAAKLVKDLGVSDMVIELGAVPYRQLHQIYRRADMYVTPAYTETFAHPLVEAMSSGIPVIASDLPVHKEICGDAAIFFPRFSAEDLSRRIVEVASTASVRNQMSSRGLVRSTAFSWKKHVDELLLLIETRMSADVRLSDWRSRDGISVRSGNQ